MGFHFEQILISYKDQDEALNTEYVDSALAEHFIFHADFS